MEVKQLVEKLQARSAGIEVGQAQWRAISQEMRYLPGKVEECCRVQELKRHRVAMFLEDPNEFFRCLGPWCRE